MTYSRSLTELRTTDDLLLKHMFRGKINLCLICKESINAADISDELENALRDHLHSVRHLDCTRDMFKQFLRDDPKRDSLNAAYLDIVNNSICVLPLFSYSSLIFEEDDDIFCAACADNICDSKDVTDRGLLDHVQEERHVNAVKNQEQWVYFFTGSREFIIYKKDLIYCSKCNLFVNMLPENNLLCCIADHISCKHVEYVALDNDKHEISSVTTKQEQLLHNNLVNLEGKYLSKLLDRCYEPTKSVVLQHKIFVKVFVGRNTYYICMCCEIYFACIDSDSMIYHLYGKRHNKNAEQGVRPCSKLLGILAAVDKNSKTVQVWEYSHNDMYEVVTLLRTENAAVKLNYQYITVDGSMFFCKICNETITFDMMGENLIGHCKTAKHNEILSEKTDSFIASVWDEPCERTSPERREALEDILASARNRHKPKLLSINARFIRIRDNRFFCLLCNMPIPGSDSGFNGHDVDSHYFSVAHTMRLYGEFCKGDPYKFEFPYSPNYNNALTDSTIFGLWYMALVA